MKRSFCLFLTFVSLSLGSDSTPFTPASLFPYTAEEVVSFGTGGLIGLSTNSSAQLVGLFCGNIALLGALAHVRCSAQLKEYKEEAQRNPFPDSPEKRKLTKDLIKEGYNEVHFVKASHPEVFSYKKKIIFFLPSDTFSNPNNPLVKSGIARLLAHVRNNSSLKRIYFYNLVSGTLTSAALALFMAKLYPLIPSPFLSRSSLTVSLGSAALAGGFYTAWLLAWSAFCQHQERQADAAVVALKDPLVLEEMARYYKEQSSIVSKKTWKQRFIEKTNSHPTNASRALFFRKEAAKMRKRQLSV